MTEGGWNCNLLKLRRDASAGENFRSGCADLKTEAWGNVSPPRENLYTVKGKEPKGWSRTKFIPGQQEYKAGNEAET